MAQVEGGWVLGMGMMLQERADYSPGGQPLYNSTWTYKIPAASCIPRVFNIALLAVRTPLKPLPSQPSRARTSMLSRHVSLGPHPVRVQLRPAHNSYPPPPRHRVHATACQMPSGHVTLSLGQSHQVMHRK